MEQLTQTTTHRSCGGSAANSMIGLAQFGGRGFHSCRVADDELGAFFARDLKANGVDNQLTPSEAGITGRCLVMITPDAERTMCTHLGVSETFAVADIDESRLADAEFLYIEGYLVSSDSAREAAITAARMARENGVKIALTFSDVSMIDYFLAGLEAIVADGIDLLFCNENEALRWSGSDSMATATQRIRTISRSHGITLGARGALLRDASGEITVASPTVKAIDTNGAGDCFAGALLYGLTHGHSLEAAGKLATHAAARLVTQYGARLQPAQAEEIRTSLAAG